MIKFNVTLCGKIFVSAQEKTTNNGEKYLAFAVTLPFKGNDESVAELHVNVTTNGTQADAANYISGRRVCIVGTMYAKRIEDKTFYNLRATNAIEFKQETDADSISGSVEFTGKIGNKGVIERTSKSGKPFQVFDAFAHDKEGEKQGFLWMNFINFNPLHEDFFKAGEYVDVNGELGVDVFKSNLSFTCRTSSIKKHEFQQAASQQAQQ